MSVAATHSVRYVVRPNPEAIKARRYELGLTAQDLAARAGISPAFVSAIEAGTRGASPPVLKRLADELGRTVGEITTMQAIGENTG